MGKYKNFNNNLQVLKSAPEQDLSNEFILGGIIDKFSMQFELSWKLLRKTLEYEGRMDGATGSPRGVIKAAFSTYDFIDEAVWLAMLADRNAAEHVYDADFASRLVKNIIDSYITEFECMQAELEALYPAHVLESF